MFIQFITTGGTIDKIYFDATSQYEVGESNVEHILGDGLVNFDYDVVPMFQKDSLEFTDENRQALKEFIALTSNNIRATAGRCMDWSSHCMRKARMPARSRNASTKSGRERM